MRSLDLPGTPPQLSLDEYYPTETPRRPWPVRPNSTGYSLSGEMELRLSLQRDYFDEADASFRIPDKKDSEVNLRTKVKRLGRGLKDLMLMRI